ncbi:MAG: heavy-metal-associated domain-containing protein [Acidobacteriota bacterium]|nr:heavy-metal-associated domain-containing protein [Acidobacteriota bacterium]
MTCAYAVRGALKKFPGVDSVDVSLNKGLATVTLKPGNTVKPRDFWEAVRRNGFTPKETRVVVRGELIGGSQFQVAVTNQTLELQGDPKILAEASSQNGKPVIIEGTLTPGKDVKTPVPLKVRSIRPGT